MPYATLVSDFDGTMAANDFYKLAVEHLLSPKALTPWEDYRAGKLTHFEALRIIFSRIRAPESDMLALVRSMDPDPNLAECVNALSRERWHVVVASAGCDWYIRRVLDIAGVPQDCPGGVEVHANPGSYSPETGLRMDSPMESEFFSPETGVDKAAIVRFHQDRGRTTAFAGDGFADLPAALEVPATLRFARADLATALSGMHEPFRPFSRWCDVASALLEV